MKINPSTLLVKAHALLRIDTESGANAAECIKLFFLASLVFLFSALFTVCHSDSPPREEAIENELNSAQTSSEKKSQAEAEQPSEIPDWLKRTSYGIVIETDQKPRIYLETVQPLYQSLDKVNTFFTHDRVSIQDERGTYSVGLGYRQLVYDDNLLLGINNFFDFQDLHKHYRTGLGLEAITNTLEFRANSYLALSKKRLVEETTGTKIFEEAVNGGDVELGAPVPYLPWLKIFGSYYRYDFRRFKDMQGWKVRGELKPYKFMTLNLETYDDNKGNQEYRLDGRLNLALDDFTLKSISSVFKPTNEAYPDRDLKECTLDRVERNFNIQVEKWVESATSIIEIYRGN